VDRATASVHDSFWGHWEVPVTARRLLPWVGALVVALRLATCGFVLAFSSETAQVVEALALREGMEVADVGAGDGDWAERLAEKVGPTGHVYATEIDAELVEDIARRAERYGLENVSALLGTATDTGLADGCCDAILLRMVYHHFSDPAPMRASLRRALRPGGRLAVIDLRPRQDWGEPTGVPSRGGHGIKEDDLVAEMTSDGFEVIARYDEWVGDPYRYCVVFRRAERPEEQR
jgi:ubiquinone/menaquinone biosynthesis C-methylase UbiE